MKHHLNPPKKCNLKILFITYYYMNVDDEFVKELTIRKYMNKLKQEIVLN